MRAIQARTCSRCEPCLSRLRRTERASTARTLARLAARLNPGRVLCSPLGGLARVGGAGAPRNTPGPVGPLWLRAERPSPEPPLRAACAAQFLSPPFSRSHIEGGREVIPALPKSLAVNYFRFSYRRTFLHQVAPRNSPGKCLPCPRADADRSRSRNPRGDHAPGENAHPAADLAHLVER